MDWAKLEEAVSDAAANGDELAAMVHKLELEKRSVTIALEPPEDEAISFSCLHYTRLTIRVSRLTCLTLRQFAHISNPTLGIRHTRMSPLPG